MEIQEITTPITIQLIPYQGFNTLRFGDEYAVVRQKLELIYPLDADGHHYYLREYYEALDMTLYYTPDERLNGASFLFDTPNTTSNYSISLSKRKFVCENITIDTLNIVELAKLFKNIDKDLQYCYNPNSQYLLLPKLGLVFHEYEKSGMVECIDLLTDEQLTHYLDN